MSENNSQDPTTKCLEKLVSDITADAKLGEFRKAANEKLTELLGGVAAEEAKYREALEELNRRWNEHNEKIEEMDRHLKRCHPIECYKKEIICPQVIQPIRDKRDEYLDKLGEPDYCLELASELHGTTEADLESWQGITQWITDRLDANKALLDEICEENCKDPRFVVYLFYFVLRPAHVSLDPDRDKDQPTGSWTPCKDWDAVCCPPPSKDEDPCAPNCDQCDVTRVCTPFLIDPDLYDCRLAAAWEAWRAAGECQVKAQCKVDEIDKARETYEEMNKPESRRTEARDALRRYAYKCCEPSEPAPEDDCPPDQQQQKPPQTMS